MNFFKYFNGNSQLWVSKITAVAHEICADVILFGGMHVIGEPKNCLGVTMTTHTTRKAGVYFEKMTKAKS